MKFSQYDLAVNNNEGGITVFNVRNSNWFKIKEKSDIEKFTKLFEQIDNLPEDDEMIKLLYKKGYVIDDGIDEYQEIKKEIDDYMNECGKHFELIIYVTQQCNFRCVYCPEEHISEKLPPKKWDALYKYIEKSLEEGKYESITISFFGGEPLLEKTQILKFLRKLKELSKKYPKVYFSHSVVTNGYLLSPKLYDELVELDVKYLQVTVDGFKETHEKLRPTANGKGSWDKIVENMKYINSKKDNVIVDYRANFNDTNIHTLKEYRKWLHETFDNPKFRFKFHPVIGFSLKVEDELLAKWDTDEKVEILKEVTDIKDRRNFDYGLHPLKRYSICKAAKPSTYTLFTDGKLSKCENLTVPYDYLYVGYLSDDGEFVFTCDMSLWNEDYEFDLCKECGMYPVCCARTCPTKKWGLPDERPDCMALRENSMDSVLDWVKQL